MLAHHSFKEKVYDIAFSPNGKLIAVTHGKHVQIWHAPGFTREFAPFVLFKEYPGHYDTVTSITWSRDSKYFLTSSKDMTARLYAVNRNDFVGACLSGHNDALIGAWFNNDETAIYTVAKDGALFEWALIGGEWNQNTTTSINQEEEEDTGIKMMPRKKIRDVTNSGKDTRPIVMRWKSKRKHYFQQNHAKVVSAAYHPKTGLISVGFDSGIFGIWELPDFANIQILR